MPKEKKTKAQWDASFRSLAASGKKTFGTGGTPTKNTPVHECYERLQKCKFGLSNLFTDDKYPCSCGYHQETNSALPSKTTKMTSNPKEETHASSKLTALPRHHVGSLPKEPTPLKKDVFPNTCQVRSRTGYFDLHLFGCTNGICLSCGHNIFGVKDVSSLKMVYMMECPVFL